MPELNKEERDRIYQEEKARREAQKQLEREEEAEKKRKAAQAQVLPACISSVIMLGLFGWIITSAFSCMGSIASMPVPSEAETKAAKKQEQKEQSEFTKRWKAVAEAVAKSGGIVEPPDPNAPRTMRIVAPGELRSYDARKIATMARERLHEDAIVYVYDDTHKRIAKADKWGVSSD